MSATEFVYTR